MALLRDIISPIQPYTIRDREGKVIGVVHELLSIAHLGKYNLTNADFRGCDLSDAYLDSVSLKGADFRGANLQHAYLGDNTLDGCLTDENTVFPEEEEQPHKHLCWM